MVVWRIEGDAVRDRIGGYRVTVFALTPGPCDVPDPIRALALLAEHSRWTRIEKIAIWVELPDYWDPDVAGNDYLTKFVRDAWDLKYRQ